MSDTDPMIVIGKMKLPPPPNDPMVRVTVDNSLVQITTDEMQRVIAEAVAAERERCAKVLEESAKHCDDTVRWVLARNIDHIRKG